MDHLPNGKYPVKEVKVFGDNYIFILPNDLMVHTHAPHFIAHTIQDVHSILIVNEGSAPLLVYTSVIKITSSNYQVVHTKEDIVEKLI